ncbi:MAG: lactate racemase domain-containing protein [Planctomycetota bacterium]|nr:lactate racemase domain-containing protein [Planctomycetota bacterium]
MTRFPRMCDVIQSFDTPRVADIVGTVQQQMQSLQLKKIIRPGQSVAIPAGSRGIANIGLILREIAGYFLSIGAVPFIVPAMGSHGGGTVEGQLRMLTSLGITEESVGVPIRATMETVIVAKTSSGLPVHFDKYASQADHVFVVGRVKPHTRFVGPVESGLHKMMLIGLGKHEGAKIYHRGILTTSFSEIVEAVAEQVLKVCRVCGGLAILENAEDETALIEAVRPEDFGRREPELLVLANRWLPRLPFDDVDLLIIDRIGKNISGVGMDANVIGRKFNDHVATPQDQTRVRRIFVRSLTKETFGNATGIGMSEFTTQRCVDQIDSESTRINCITGLHPEAAMIPITLPTDAAAVESALQTIGMIEPEDARVIQISDTLHLTHVRVSEAYFADVRKSKHLRLDGEPYDFPTDAHGWLQDV